jgi:transcriptional regulator with XRE-family HTH domain
MAAVALASGVSVDALRKIESGRVPTPALFTVAALATALGLSLDALVDQVHEAEPADAAPGYAS